MLEPIQLCENGPAFSRIVFGVMKWGRWGHQLDTRQMLRRIEQRWEHVEYSYFLSKKLRAGYKSHCTFAQIVLTCIVIGSNIVTV